MLSGIQGIPLAGSRINGGTNSTPSSMCKCESSMTSYPVNGFLIDDQHDQSFFIHLSVLVFNDGMSRAVKNKVEAEWVHRNICSSTGFSFKRK